MRKLTGLLAFVTVVLLSGCLFNPDDDARDEVRDNLLENVRVQRGIWQDLEVDDYTWTYVTVDTRISPVSQEVTAIVQDGEVAEVTVDAGYTEPGPLESYLTVDETFDVIEQALEDDADNLRVGYSDGSVYPDGVPVFFEIDYDDRSSGDEYYVEVGDFDVAGDEE